MVCGGTGITPMYQVLRTIAERPDDETRVDLITAQKSLQDVLLMEGLKRCVNLKPDQIKIHFIFSDPSRENGGAFPFEKTHGQIDENYLSKHLPSSKGLHTHVRHYHLPCADYVILVCGPEAMMESICGAKNPDKTQGKLSGHLASLGQDESHVYKF